MDIKIRAWDKKRKEMFIVHDLKFSKIDGTPTTAIGYTPDSGGCWNVFGGSNMKYCNDERYAFMSGTNLKDNKSDCVFIGDILCNKNTGELYVIENDYKLLSAISDFSIDYIEVVGNIYENRELLKGE